MHAAGACCPAGGNTARMFITCAEVCFLQTCLVSSCSSRVAVLTEVNLVGGLKANHITV